MADLNVLGEGEMLCEVEEALLDEKPGVLVVTDLRLLWMRTSVFRRRTKVVAVPLRDVKAVEASEDPMWEKRWGALTIAVRSPAMNQLEFAGIPGGQPRAEEIERTILRQREYLKPTDL